MLVFRRLILLVRTPVTASRIRYNNHRKSLGLMGQLIANPSFDWTFLTAPQKSANARVILQPRGKGLGGSSLVNTLLLDLYAIGVSHRRNPLLAQFHGIITPLEGGI